MNRDQAIATLRGLVAEQRLAEARDFCLELTRANPEDPELWMMRADLHLRLGELDDVVACARQVLALDPHNAGAQFGLGLALQGLRRVAEAEPAYRAALRLQPGFPPAFAQLLGLLLEQQRLEEARQLLVETTAVLTAAGSTQHTMLVDAWRALATAQINSGGVAAALHAYQRLLTVAPEDADAHTCAGMCHLLLGDLSRGWPEYEWRLQTRYMAGTPTGMPRWQGEPLDGKVILVCAEQGHGDTVQFVRYARKVKARGGSVILACQPALRRLLAGCAGVDQAVTQGEPAPRYDVETTLLSLPGIFQTTLDTLPADVPYLHVPAGAGADAVAAIARHTGVLRVGLVWAGGLHTVTPHRSLTLQQLGPLFDVAGVHFFSLQKGAVNGELASLPQHLITDLDPCIGDFADTAAAIQALDLVISVDTAVAHVAGALACPVWTLIPFAPDWRWMLQREDSPWYPTMRLFRQTVPGDWAAVIRRIAAQLRERV